MNVEPRATAEQTPARRVVLVIVFLALLGLGLSAWYSLAQATHGPTAIAGRALASPVTSNGPLGPDAQDRDLAQRISRIREDSTHGH